MIPTITDHNVFNVKRAFDIYIETAITKTKATTAYLDTLSPTELWLLSFVYYVKERNKRWLGVDFSAFYSIPPSTVQKSTFTDFLALLSTYSAQHVSHHNEKELVLFLAGCTREIREFYEIIMSKEKAALFGNREIRGYLDLSQVKAEEIYAGGIMVTTAPSPLPLAIIRQTLGKNTSAVIKLTPKTRGSNFTHTRMKGLLTLDRKLIHTAEYLLFGLLDEEHDKFYPLDYFEGYKEYVRFAESGHSSCSYRERLNKLASFLNKNYLRQIQKLPIEYCVSGSQIANAVAEVLKGSPHSTVVICNDKNEVQFKPTIELQGVSDSLWMGDAGEVLGLKVWNMGRVVNCSFDFSGDNHALIYNPKLLLKKYVRFYLFSDKEECGVVKEILFEKRLFKPDLYTFVDGTEGYIECCVWCLQDHGRHSHNGICDSTLKCWYRAMATYGVDTWFPASYAILRRRKAMGWRPEFFRNVVAVFRGYAVVIEGDMIMFQTDEEAKRIYDWRVEARAAHGTMPEIKHTTPEAMRQAYEGYEAKNKRDRRQKKYDLLFGGGSVEA